MSQPENPDVRSPGLWDPYIDQYNRVSEGVIFGRLSPEREILFRHALGRLFRVTHGQIEPLEDSELITGDDIDETPLVELDRLWAEEENFARGPVNPELS